MPFPDDHFDIVTTFSSLDQVDDVDAAIPEMTRETRVGVICLVMVEVNHPPTPTEPHTLPWDVCRHFTDWAAETRIAPAARPDHDLYRSFCEATVWVNRPGVLGERLGRLCRGESA